MPPARPARNEQDLNAPPRAVRHRLPEERASITHKFSIAGHEGYITVGLYPNGQPGEIFIRMAKEGSTVSRPDGRLRHLGFARLAARRAAEGAVREVRAHALRAFGLDGQRADRLRQEPDGLHLPLAQSALPFGRAVDALRRAGSQGAATARLAQPAAGERSRRGRCRPRRSSTWRGWPRKWPSG